MSEKSREGMACPRRPHRGEECFSVPVTNLTTEPVVVTAVRGLLPVALGTRIFPGDQLFVVADADGKTSLQIERGRSSLEAAAREAYEVLVAVALSPLATQEQVLDDRVVRAVNGLHHVLDGDHSWREGCPYCPAVPPGSE